MAPCCCHTGTWSIAWLASLMPSIMLTFGWASALRLRSFSSSLRSTLKASPMSLNMPIVCLLSVEAAERRGVGGQVVLRRGKARLRGVAPARGEDRAADQECDDAAD